VLSPDVLAARILVAPGAVVHVLVVHDGAVHVLVGHDVAAG